MLREEYRQWRDWVYEHYPWAYALGTGVLALAAWGLCRPLRRRPAWVWGGYMATLGIGALLEPCVDPASSLYGSVLAHGRRDKP